jgi:hypothetical protein
MVELSGQAGAEDFTSEKLPYEVISSGVKVLESHVSTEFCTLPLEDIVEKIMVVLLNYQQGNCLLSSHTKIKTSNRPRHK